MSTTATLSTIRTLQRNKTALASRFTCTAFLLAACFPVFSASQRFVPGQLLVKPKDQLSETDFTARLRVHHAQHRQTLSRLNVRVLNVAEENADAILTALQHDPGIAFAERDAVARAAFVPNDTYVVSGAEWHLAKIGAPSAWSFTSGNFNTVVAIIDSGINAAHPDLAGHVLPGFDFVWNDTDCSDDFGHGTAVAGVVAAAGNNGVGVAGVAFNCSLLPVKVMDVSGLASYSSVAQGIRYAVDQGARVINISIAGDSPSSTLQDAVNYAWSNNVVVVAAAGNGASDVPQYPAACDHVLAVAATEPDDSLAPFSSYGSYVSLSAPGDAIWTTQRDLSNPYGAWRGTSFASPIVAGVAALAISANPALSNNQVVSTLENGADDLGTSGYDTTFGFGRVNALAVVNLANPDLTPSQTSNAPPASGPGPLLVPVAEAGSSTATLSLHVVGEGHVVPNLNGQQLQVGKQYTLRGIPGPRQVFGGWDGLPSQSPVLKFVMESNLLLTASFVPTPFPTVSGQYGGLAANSQSITPDNSACFKVSVTPMGAFSGRILSQGRGYGFHGKFNIASGATVTVKRGPLAPLTLQLRLNLANPNDQITGDVTDGTWASQLLGNRNIFNARLNPALQAGLHSFVLQPADNQSSEAGTGASRISKSGSAAVRGKLSTGHPFAIASSLSKNGDCPFYLSLNHGSEIVIGWLNFPSQSAPLASGTILWVNTGANAFAATLNATSVP